jgi:hypothetical protein
MYHAVKALDRLGWVVYRIVSYALEVGWNNDMIWKIEICPYWFLKKLTEKQKKREIFLTISLPILNEYNLEACVLK